MAHLVPAFAGGRVTSNSVMLVQTVPGLSSFTANWIIAKIRDGQNIVSKLSTLTAWTARTDAYAANPSTRTFVLADTPSLYNAVQKTTDRSISQAVIECDNKFRERILFRREESLRRERSNLSPGRRGICQDNRQ